MITVEQIDAALAGTGACVMGAFSDLRDRAFVLITSKIKTSDSAASDAIRMTTFRLAMEALDAAEIDYVANVDTDPRATSRWWSISVYLCGLDAWAATGLRPTEANAWVAAMRQRNRAIMAILDGGV